MAGPDLSRMSEQEAIAALRQYYANAGPLTAQPRDSTFQQDPQFSQGVVPSYGNDKLSGFRPEGDGYFGNLTSPFDPLNPGGRYGSYQGKFSADGTLDPSSVAFSPEERSGSFLSENMLPITLAVMGGTAAINGFGLPGVAGGGGGGYTPFIPELAADGYLAGGLPEAFTGAAEVGGTMGYESFIPNTAADSYLAEGVPEMFAPPGGTPPGGLPSGPEGLGPYDTPPPPGSPPMPTTPPTLPGGEVGKWILQNGKWVAGLAGAALAGSNSGPDVATTSSDVPEWAQKYGPDIVGRGQAIADTPFQPYTGQRFAGPNDALRQSWEMANQTAQGPSAGQQVSQGTFNRLQSGAVPDFGKATQVDNQYIGQTTPGASNQYIGQNANSNVSGLLSGQANPMLGQTTGSIGPLGQMNLAQTTTDVGRNALLGQNNPYLNDAIGFATGDITRNFNNTINPQLDRMARASGSFGNSGVEQARQEAQRTMAQQVGRTTSDMRMQDYNLQAQLGEGDLGRRLQAGLTDASRNLGASQAMQQFNIGNDFARQQANMGYRAGDLTRNMAGYDAAQGRMLDAGKFDATNAQRNWETNLGATSDLGKFNSSLAQADLGRNAQLTGQQQQFNAGQGNFDITGARNDWNSAEGRAAQTMGAYQGYDQANTNRIAMLNTTGNEMNRFAQQPLDFQNQEFMRQQAYPAQQLGVYQNAYNTGVNGQGVQSTPTGNSPAANLLGGATAAMGLYNLYNAPQQQTTQDTTQPRWFTDFLATQRR